MDRVQTTPFFDTQRAERTRPVMVPASISTSRPVRCQQGADYGFRSPAALRATPGRFYCRNCAVTVAFH
jgi:hypothetical protein